MTSSILIKMLILLSLILVWGCRMETDHSQPEAHTTPVTDPEARNGLPHAQGQSFRTLDDYLLHLQKMGMQDRPYYEETAPGQYRLNVGRGSQNHPPQYFTREELLEKYGFSK